MVLVTRWEHRPTPDVELHPLWRVRPCRSIPLLSVLRDDLGDASPENDRISYLWLLTAGRSTPGQRLLSAVPFFYWKVGSASAPSTTGYPAPLINLNTPLHPVINHTGRAIVQWVGFDPVSTAVRASSRSYQSNQSDNERIYLEQAIECLKGAPAGGTGPGLTASELDTLIARLELRKSMLGDLLRSQRTAHFGEQYRFEDQRIRARNFDALRQFAEKTGTYIERLTLAGNSREFAVLWFPLGVPQPVTGVSDKPIWKLLNLHDPWQDRTIDALQNLSFERSFDEGGRLLPVGATGARAGILVPLAIYSLSYPEMPLLLVDFRHNAHIRNHELAQRSITELTAGILGLSHFANWYYYAGAEVYHLLWARHGIAAEQADRLDSYARFRMDLVLDNHLDSKLLKEMTRHAGSLNVNPLDSDPARNIANARLQYARLEKAAGDSNLSERLDRERRAELASFGESTKATVFQTALHYLSFGSYTHRVSNSARNLAELDHNRRITYQLDYLDAVTRNGTDPRIAVSETKLDDAVLEVRTLLPTVSSGSVRQRAQATLARVETLSSRREQMAKQVEVADKKAVIR